MNCLITGGAGFIGSHIAERLLKDGHRVWIVDDLSAGYESNIPDGATFIRGNIIHPQVYRDVLKNIDVVYHNAASKKNVCLSDPPYDLEVNGKATLRLLMECVDAGVKRFVHASTGSVYGETDRITESTLCNPVSYYGVSKLAGERYANMFRDKMEVSILRYFHVYGDGQEDDAYLGGVVAIFKKMHAYGNPLVIHGDGNQMRSFTHVDDIVEANMLVRGGVYNVASGYYTSILELADMVGGDKIFRDALEGDIYNFNIDNSKIKTLGIKFKRINDYFC